MKLRQFFMVTDNHQTKTLRIYHAIIFDLAFKSDKS